MRTTDLRVFVKWDCEKLLAVTIVSVIAYLLFFASALLGAGDDMEGILPHGVTMSNCGINVLLFTFSFFEIKCPLDDKNVTELTGSYHQEPLAFGTMEVLLRQQGLATRCYKGGTPSEVIANLDRCPLAIVQLQGLRANHYIALAKEEKGIDVFFSTAVKKENVEEVTASLYANFQGNVMFVSKNPSDIDRIVSDPTVPYKALADARSGGTGVAGQIVANKRQNASKLIGGKDLLYPEIVKVLPVSRYISDSFVPVTISNTGSETVTISNPTGACSCFRGIIGNLTIPPKSQTELKFHFRNFDFSNTGGTQVVVRSNDAQLRNFAISFIPGSITTTVSPLSVISQVVDLGVVTGGPPETWVTFEYVIDERDSNYAYPVGWTADPKLVKTVDASSKTIKFGEMSLRKWAFKCMIGGVLPRAFAVPIKIYTCHPNDYEITFIAKGTTTRPTNDIASELKIR